MRSVLRGVVGVLLVIVVVITVLSSAGQTAAPKADQDEKLPIGVPLAPQPDQANKKSILARIKSSRASHNARPNFAETRTVAKPAVMRRRPGGSEASEPTTNAPPFGSPRRWPPAYETRPADASNGQTGVILFDDDPAPAGKPAADKGKAAVILFDDNPMPTAKPALATTATPPLLKPADLQRRVKSVCGRRAQAVLVETQRDGTIAVKVKVPSLSVEDQLTRKIFAIPGMTSPKVRLIMDVGP